VSDPQRLVLDASVGVKWFKPEAGRASALDLLRRAARGDLSLFVPTHFVHEVLSVVRRHYSATDIVPAWELMNGAGVTIVQITDDVVAEAARQCESLGCQCPTRPPASRSWGTMRGTSASEAGETHVGARFPRSD